MIIYQGVKQKNNIWYLNLFINSEKTVSIPIETVSAQRILQYLQPYTPAAELLPEEQDEQL